MNKKIKIGIVAGLLIIVSVVLAVKQNQKSNSQNIAEKKESISLNQPDTNENLPKLIDLGAGKCIPCKMMAPILDDLKKEYAGRFNVEVIDVWQNPEAGKSFDIKMIPTQIFFNKEGKELFRHEGFFSKEDILNKWKELGINFSDNK